MPQKYKQSVHFTTLPASPCATEFYEIWHTISTHRRNHVCQNFSQSVQGLRSSDTPKLPFPIDLLRCPYNNVRIAVRHCDKKVKCYKQIIHQHLYQKCFYGRGMVDPIKIFFLSNVILTMKNLFAVCYTMWVYI